MVVGGVTQKDCKKIDVHFFARICMQSSQRLLFIPIFKLY